jgi:hypothetical protein
MHWIRAAIAVAILAGVGFFALMVARGLGGVAAVLIVQLGSLCGIAWFGLDIFLIFLRGNPFRARSAWLGLVLDLAGMIVLGSLLAWVGRVLMA